MFAWRFLVSSFPLVHATSVLGLVFPRRGATEFFAVDDAREGFGLAGARMGTADAFQDGREPHQKLETETEPLATELVSS